MTSLTYHSPSRRLLDLIPDLGPEISIAASASPPLGRFTATSAALHHLLAHRAAALDSHRDALRSHRCHVASFLDDIHRSDTHLAHALTRTLS